MEGDGLTVQAESLRQIFTKRVIHVPDYQRRYSWEERQIDDLWNDFTTLFGCAIAPNA